MMIAAIAAAVSTISALRFLSVAAGFDGDVSGLELALFADGCIGTACALGSTAAEVSASGMAY
jgi:hypothetical protein